MANVEISYLGPQDSYSHVVSTPRPKSIHAELIEHLLFTGYFADPERS